ncbi:MAG: hypothetical protein KBS91_04700, partial [Firmicutes bacterium]|nr:hypothetical protein [Candidatus Caballimonas caccae]
MVNLSNTKPEEQSIIAKILLILWQRIFIVIIAVVIALVAFACYFKLKKPDFTAYEQVNYVVKNMAAIDDKGNFIKNSTSHINSEKKYASTVAKFFATGNVCDRANFYYNQFIELMEEKGYALGIPMRSIELEKYIYTINGIRATDRILNEFKYDEQSKANESIFDIFLKGNDSETPNYSNATFISQNDNKYEFSYNDNGEIKQENINKNDVNYILFSPIYNPYIFNANNKYNYFSKSNISVTYDEEQDSSYFTVSYKDVSQAGAAEKVKMIVLAANQEIKLKDNNDEYVYFKTLNIDLHDFGSLGVPMNVSRKKMLVLFVGVGLLIGVVCVYLSTLIETSVTSKKELEEITGVPLLTHIE